MSLWRNDKIPYGTYYAYENLKYIFNNSDISTSDNSPVTFYDDEYSSAYIIIGREMKPDDRELQAILNHAATGNHVFISAIDISDNVLDSFRLKTSGGVNYFRDSMNVSVVDPAGPYSLKFNYPGYGIDSYFTKMDSSVTNILGRNEDGKPNFVKFNYQGGGTVMIHLAPLTFTNFFLLHKKNKQYYDVALSSIPDSVSEVRWDDYYRHHVFGKDQANRSAFSKLGAFLKNDVLRWAFWLTVLLFALIYLFESKRKQRIVPAIKKLNNTSLDFVKTIGRLYFQRKDNKNLAAKMSTHLLSFIRGRFNLSTSKLDDDFASKLAYKSGYPLALVTGLISDVKTMEDAQFVSDEQLLDFNDKIDSFINKV